MGEAKREEEGGSKEFSEGRKRRDERLEGEEKSRELGNHEKLKQRKEKNRSAGVKVGCEEFVQNNMSSFSQTHKQQKGRFGSWEGNQP